ncbi:unnamed protein product [Schistocephalus solidus]|uniref:Ectonucleotide pyrophosphatase/phosphodiesterase family member 6 n=1 Tax=Schistocephalus solidus TaxID=70667 RepID=A0A183S762_SCHSO|nr:unnamed protein product [Schistocephalus solidus]
MDHVNDVGHQILTLYIITQWLSVPNVKFVSAYIPASVTENSELTNVVTSANSVLAHLIQAVRNNKLLSSTVNFILLGGVNPPKSSLNVHELQFPISWFRSYVSQARYFEAWPSFSHKNHDLEKDTAHYFSCNTRKFRERHPHLDIGVLPPLYLVAKPGYVLRVRGLSTKKEEKKETEDVPSSAFLLVSGPQFNTCSPSTDDAEAIQLTDIYSLVSWLLGIRRPSRHAGRLSRVRHLLRVPPTPMQLEQFERHAAGLSQPPELALLRDPYILAFGVSIILLAATLAVVICIFACRQRLGVCYCACCLRGATKRRLQRNRRWRKLHSTGQDSALLVAANGDPGGIQEGRFLGAMEADEEEEEGFNGSEEMVIMDQRARRGNSADFLNMLHGPLESGLSRTKIPVL